MSTANIRQLNSQALNGGQFGGLRNLLINATFKINQRSYVSGTATTTANQYTLDRWRVPASGQNVTFTANGARNIVTAPASGIEQVIEGDNIFGGTYTINWEGTASCYINGVEATKGSQVTLIGGTAATVKFVGGSVELPQLEHGIRDTEFEHRWKSLEELLCQRYAFGINEPAKSAPWDGGILGIGTGISSTDLRIFIPTPVEMRAKPSYIQVTGGLFVYAGAGGISAPGLTVISKSSNGLYVAVTGVSGVGVGVAHMLATQTVATRVMFECEL